MVTSSFCPGTCDHLPSPPKQIWKCHRQLFYPYLGSLVWPTDGCVGMTGCLCRQGRLQLQTVMLGCRELDCITWWGDTCWANHWYLTPNQNAALEQCWAAWGMVTTSYWPGTSDYLPNRLTMWHGPTPHQPIAIYSQCVCLVVTTSVCTGGGYIGNIPTHPHSTPQWWAPVSAKRLSVAPS